MSSNITTKICVYGCGLNLYWNKDYNDIGKYLPGRDILVLIEATNLQELLLQQQ
jgi:hypothetical protein